MSRDVSHCQAVAASEEVSAFQKIHQLPNGEPTSVPTGWQPLPFVGDMVSTPNALFRIFTKPKAASHRVKNRGGVPASMLYLHHAPRTSPVKEPLLGSSACACCHELMVFLFIQLRCMTYCVSRAVSRCLKALPIILIPWDQAFDTRTPLQPPPPNYPVAYRSNQDRSVLVSINLGGKIRLNSTNASRAGRKGILT